MSISQTTPSPLPTSLPLAHPQTPWKISDAVFSRLSASSSFKQCQLLPSDPEYQFVYQYFHHQQPTNRAIKRILCVHNPSQSIAFEGMLPAMEQEAHNPVFQPQWQTKETLIPQRKKAMERFEQASSSFSPFVIPQSARRQDTYHKVKILPLWHGSSAQKCKSIAMSGFAFFGKHNVNNNNANSLSTDIGFFGSGIYFTNSARYATDIYSDGEHLMLAWVSMRDPYPVVSDVPSTQECSDMKKLKGHGAYENYNAHYIPVVSIDPQNKQCAIYYPCYQGQEPACDEVVVFNKGQTLARFWVEMQIDLPAAPSGVPTADALLTLVLDLLEKEAVHSQSDLMKILEQKAEILIAVTSQTLTQEDLEFYKWAKQLLDSSHKVRNFVAQKLMGSSPHSAKKQITPPPQTNASSFSHVKEHALSLVNPVTLQRNWKALPSEQTIQGHTSSITTLIELKDGTLASGSWDKTIKLWNRQGTCLSTLTGHTLWVTTLIELKDGTLASGSQDTTIKLWNRQGTCLSTLTGHTSYVTTLIELKDDTVASGSYDSTIKLWNRQGTCLTTFTGHTEHVTTLIELKDGTLASGSYDDIIKLWNRQGTCFTPFTGHTDVVFTLIELKDGTLASESADGTIKLWNRQGACLSTLKGYTGSIFNFIALKACIATRLGTLIELKDGTLASGSWDNTIKLWNRQGTCLSTLRGHTDYVITLIELKDGTVASGSQDTTIKLWNRQGACLSTLTGHTSYVTTLIELKDGTLASESADGTIKLWTFPAL